MSRVGDSVSRTVRTIVYVAVAAVLVLVGMQLGQRTADQRSGEEIARVRAEADTALAAAEAGRAEAVAGLEAQVTELTAGLEAARAEAQAAATEAEAAKAALAEAAAPAAAEAAAADVGSETCAAVAGAGGFGEARVTDWVADVTSGIALGRELAGREPLDLGAAAGLEAACAEDDTATLGETLARVLTPVFEAAGEADGQ